MIDRFAFENLQLIEKFISLKYISLENVDLLVYMFQKVLFQRIVFLFSNNKSKLARMIILISIPPLKYFIFYFASFIPVKFYNNIARVYRFIK